jgi:replication factor C subunit 3/5
MSENYLPTTTTTPTPTNKNIPWIEKYRPSNFNSIVLDPINRILFENILEKRYFPNMLFYGPPGTGKTTTIINLINEYQSMDPNGTSLNKTNIIHLNASDERGIDIIRNQINQFVKTNNFFESGIKFIILDEVDYMTKNAQQALKYLIQLCSENVRFCLICNYISKIDISLKNEFICIRFNQLPKQEIFAFIKNVVKEENIVMSDRIIESIQNLYHSDIRSMINFIQMNQMTEDWENHIITDDLFEDILCRIRTRASAPSDNHKKNFRKFIHMISVQYNIDKRSMISLFFNYFIRNHTELITNHMLDNIETIIHSSETAIDYTIDLLYDCGAHMSPPCCVASNGEDEEAH